MRISDWSSDVCSSDLTSMEIGIKVITEDIRRQIVRHANSCYFTMVAVDDNGQPTAVPQLEVRTLEEKQRHEAARERRELRQAKTRRASWREGCVSTGRTRWPP